jgi:uncharacterized protein GlcG (DUF336 family)
MVMRQPFVLLGALVVLVAQPLAAAQYESSAAKIGPLAPGKPGGVKPAQADDLVPIYGGVLLFGAILAATIGVSGSSVSPNTATTGTSFCCG